MAEAAGAEGEGRRGRSGPAVGNPWWLQTFGVTVAPGCTASLGFLPSELTVQRGTQDTELDTEAPTVRGGVRVGEVRGPRNA